MIHDGWYQMVPVSISCSSRPVIQQRLLNLPSLLWLRSFTHAATIEPQWDWCNFDPWPPARQSDIPQGAASCQPRARGFFFRGTGECCANHLRWSLGVRENLQSMQFFLPKREVFVNFPSSPMWENDEKWQGMMNTMVSTSDIYCLTCRWSWALGSLQRDQCP